MPFEVGFSYTPERPPDNASAQELVTWALQELEKASNVINNLAEGKCTLLNAPPKRPRNGMIRMADGTNWDPGGGRGYYGYDEASATWRKLG